LARPFGDLTTARLPSTSPDLLDCGLDQLGRFFPGQGLGQQSVEYSDVPIPGATGDDVADTLRDEFDVIIHTVNDGTR
jgi:hypothetical protein